MPKATINGVKLEADTQKELDALIDRVSKNLGGSTKTESKPRKPKPESSQQTQPSPKKAPPKLTGEAFVKALKEDAGSALVKAISGELGFDVKEQFGILTSSLSGLTKDFIYTSAALALERNNIEPTDANIKELYRLTGARKGQEANVSLQTLSAVAKEAAEEEWMEVKKDESKSKSESKKGSKRQPEADDLDEGDELDERIPAASRGRKAQLNDSEDEDSNPSTEEELEELMSKMSEEELLEAFSGVE